MKSCPLRPARLVAALALLGLVFLAMPLLVAYADSQPQSSGCSGYYYTVRRGDTWSIIARRVGVSVADLKQANPRAVRPRDVILAYEKLCIPSKSQGATQTPQSGGRWYQVRPGDTWNTISRATGVPVRQLMEANPGLVNRRMWLYIGQRVWIPEVSTGTATPAASASPTEGTPMPPAQAMPTAGVPATAEASATVAAIMTPTTRPTDTPWPPADAATATVAVAEPSPVSTATPVPTAGATAAQATGTAPADTPTALPPKPSDCPKTIADYDAAIARFLNNPANTVERLNHSLALCRVAATDKPGAISANILGPKNGDVVVAINDADTKGPGWKGALLVYHKGQNGYALAQKREGQGRIDLVKVGDINADGKFDLVYSDTSCGAHTCFGTLFVDSWDGKTYADWIEDDPTMAQPVYTLKEASSAGTGDEILAHGGVIGSVGAGPQRAWTETYISPAGGPYKLLSQVYDPSDCLYHKIIDANRAFDAWALDGFDPAIAAYQAAIADKNAQSCGTIKDEVKTLQDFARFRLVVAEVAGGSASEGIKIAPEITHPGLKKAASGFLTSYAANGSVLQACRDTTKVAESDPTTWQFLADWGYANPSFTAQELCPLN